MCRVDVIHFAIKSRHTIFTWFDRLSMSIGLCLDARISTDMIQGLLWYETPSLTTGLLET